MSILKYVKLLVWTTNARLQLCLQVLFFTLNYQLKAGIHNDNAFKYQYRNWLFGFTLAPSLLLPAIIIHKYYAVNNNNDDNIKPFFKHFITADENQIHVWK